jgi:uncharacterized Rmd1/YagE family protein
MALCSKPYIHAGHQPVPCGQCAGCLTNRKQLWTHRIILESIGHEKNAFITLTYSNENVPYERSEKEKYTCEKTGKEKEKWVFYPTEYPTLSKYDLTRFFKNLRNRTNQKFRYYAVGEYGTKGARGINPHFHICLFGLGEEAAGIIQDSWRTETGSRTKGDPLGYTYTGSLTPQSAAYVAGYVQKKTKYNKDMWEEFEITPEYSTMSNRPGIGAHAVPKIAEALQLWPEGLTPTGDVPTSIMHGNRKLPLGNYLREKIREEMQLDHTLETWMDPITGEIEEKKKWHGKELFKEVLKAELLALQENKEDYDPKLTPDAQASIKHAIEYRDKQKILNFDAKQKLSLTKHTL